MKTIETATAAVPTVTPTPTEESEPVTSPTAPARSGSADIDGQALAQLLSKGAEFLQSVGRALAEPGSPASPDADAASRPRITADAATGKSELRIPVPDSQTLQQWMGQLSNVLSAFQQRK